MKSRLTAYLLTALLLCIVIGTAVLASEWPMYRHDRLRTGKADADALTATSPVPIWVFPKPVTGVDAVDNDFGTKDEPDFAATGTWTEGDSDMAPNAYNGNFVYAAAGSGATATWTFPLTQQRGGVVPYYVSVWFPSRAYGDQPQHASNAPYTVEIWEDGGTAPVSSETIKVNQRSGGNWLVLSASPYQVKETQYVVVRLSAGAANSDVDGIVIADAVRLSHDAGHVLSSPAFAPGSAAQEDDLVITSVAENRPMQTVTVTVPDTDDQGNNKRDADGNIIMKNMAVQSGSVRVGVVYGLHAEDQSVTVNRDDRGLENWRFPFHMDNWIAGGFSSSPVIGTLNGTEVAYCAAKDGQLYVIKTVWGGVSDDERIVWQGPGYIDDDPNAPSWTSVTDNSGRQGPDYRRTTAVSPTGAETKAKWSFNVRSEGRYSIYAWIPPSTTTAIQIPDAKYTVTIGSVKYPATADQRSGGRWASLGTYDFDSTGTGSGNCTIELSNKSEMMNTADAVGRYVSADAIKIVPAGLGIFDWSSPLVSSDGEKVYIGTTGGRVYCFDVSDPNNHDPEWVYPAADKNPIGAVYASPTFSSSGDSIYVGSADGHVYKIKASDGTEEWCTPTKTPASGETLEIWGEISSSIAVRGDMLYFGVGSDSNLPPMGSNADTTGRVIGLRDNGDTATRVWTYPGTTEEATGSFLYASPLIFDRSPTDVTLVIGSTEGTLLGLDPLNNGTAKWTEFPDLGDTISSSAAGVMVPSEIVPMGYVGSITGSLHGIDLRDGSKRWSYRLLGAVDSSPALAEGRLYVGDMSGLTWAFSSRPGGGDDGMEEWNPDTGLDDPPGQETDADSNIKSKIEVDIFRRQEWEAIKNDERVLPQGTINDPDLHKFARAEVDYNPADEPAHGHRLPFAYEWGETVYIIAWNCLDPNDPKSADVETKWEKGKPRGKRFVSETDSTVRITIKSRGPGDESDQSTALTMTEKGSFQDKDGNVIFYTKYAYVLGISSSSSTQAPGSRITVSVQELPSTKSDSPSRGGTAGDCTAPEHNPIPTHKVTVDHDNDPATEPVEITEYDHAKYKPQRIAINNPLGLICKDPVTGVIGYVGVTSAGATDRAATNFSSDVHYNGNQGNTPYLRAGLVGHGTNSDEHIVVACDRSLIRLTGNNLSKFRMEREDLGWNGGPGQIWNGPCLPWELPPPPIGSNAGNASQDYPDIRSRQVGFAMAESRLDPTQESIDLRPGEILTLPPTTQTWNVGQNPVGQVVSIPRYQPANMPSTWPTTNATVLQGTGFTGHSYVFIDSNGDGRLNLAGSLGSTQMFQASVTGTRSEAYRRFHSQVYVPPDYRVELAEKTYDIGAVPHGFGLTAQSTSNPLPALFLPTLGQNAKLVLPGVGETPGVFHRWFQPFTAYNEGNVNLKNLRVAKTVQSPGVLYNLDLFSDTADGGVYGSSTLQPYGAYIPAAGIVSAIDPRFVGDPLFSPILGLSSRTFHKPRVGEQATVLRVPDMPKRLYTSHGYTSAVPPPRPFFSIAVPLGTPVGTYSRTLTLFEDANNNNIFEARESVGNPIMEAKVTVTENRMTDGTFPGSLPQVDVPVSGVSIGDVAPAAFRDAANNLHMYWSSSRLGSATPTAGDPWYLHKSNLPLGGGYWNLAVTNPVSAQWWMPTANSFPARTIADVATFFDQDASGNDKPGVVQMNSVKFSSPSVVQNVVSNQLKSWLFFGGEAVRHDAASGNKWHEYKAFYWPLDADGTPTGSAYSSTHDWTMPKYGIRGAAATIGGRSTLWTFWYGGNNSQWRIYYNMSPLKSSYTAGDPDSWSNDARLPLPRGLSSAAEPSIIPRLAMDTNRDEPTQIQVLDVIYSAHSQYHKNTDIYLTRYKPDLSDITNGAVEMDMVGLPAVTEDLTRDPASAIFFSRHVDWEVDHDIVPMNVRVFPDRTSSANVLLTVGTPTRDAQTNSLIYSYEGNTAAEQECKRLFRTVVINPEAGTVKFLRDPGPNSRIRATYVPRAYRLTTDGAADSGPCALFDSSVNNRALVAANSFWAPSGSVIANTPVDRMWMLWRRPSTVMKGTGVYYKSFRYTARLNDQIAMNAAADVSFSPEPAGPVEIDWAKKRLYFTHVDDGKQLNITYPNAAGNDVTEPILVRFEEELDLHGNAFGNLTSEVSNEGQVCALRDPDPYVNKLWVFWTSTRAGNTDIYYETICPRFYAREFK